MVFLEFILTIQTSYKSFDNLRCMFTFKILDTKSYSFESEQIKIEQISEISSIEFEEVDIEKVVKKTHKDVVVKDVFRHNWTKKLTLNKPVPKSQLN